MALTSKAVKSLKKVDLINQKSPALGFSVLRFAHKADAGEASISLMDLTTPPEMSALGFVQPSSTELANAHLSLLHKNLVLISSARGLLTEHLDYVVSGDSTIIFSELFGPALQDEIFIGTIDPIARTGSPIADTLFILETGTLKAGNIDIPVGKSFKANQNPNNQVGAVLVIVDGQTLLRNVGNATAHPSADGDYEEVDNGAGDCTLIRLNVSSGSDRPYIVLSNGISVLRGDGSILDELEKQQGTVDKLVETVAVLAGVSEDTFRVAPTQPQLKQFGDRVITLENNRARIDQDNAWTAAQSLVGVTDGSSAGAGKLGQEVRATSVTNQTFSAIAAGSYQDSSLLQITLTPGDWEVECMFSVHANWNAGTSGAACVIGAIRDASNTVIGSVAVASFGDPAGALNVPDIVMGGALVKERVSISSMQTYKVSVKYENYSGTVTSADITIRNADTTGVIRARRVR